jgi:tyrosine-specific transport protein
MNNKLIGGILLIVGTSIGAGMLALPLVSAEVGILRALIMFVVAWFLMTTAAVYILKVNLTLPHGSNMISMARHTIGKSGQVVTWISYLLLLYCLLSAYLAGGADLLINLCHMLGFGMYHWMAVLVFLAIFGAIIFHGVKIVDMANRGLMTVKLGSFALLVFLLVSHVHAGNFAVGNERYVPSAILVVITSFGFAVIVPSLRDYFGEDDHLMIKAILIGSLIPLICYILWIFIVLGVVPRGNHLGDLSQLVGNLSKISHSGWVTDFVHLFSYVCITTSFLGVSLALTDFVADGFKLEREKSSRWTIMAITYVPPVVMVLFYPAAFIRGLALAGVFCIILLMLLPALMALKINVSNRWLVWLVALASLGLLIFALFRL